MINGEKKNNKSSDLPGLSLVVAIVKNVKLAN